MSHFHSLQHYLPPRPFTWDHTSTVSSVTPTQTLYLGSNICSLWCGTPYRSCTCCHMLTVSKVTHLQTPCTWGQTYTVSRVTPLPDPEPEVTHPQSRVRIPKHTTWVPIPKVSYVTLTSNPAFGFTRPVSRDTLPDPVPEVTCLQFSG